MSERKVELPTLAHLGGTRALTTTPVVGTPAHTYADSYVPGTEQLGAGEIRVSVLGSGDPFIKRSQASGSLLIEVGNAEKDLFFFDLGSGALANFSSLLLPVESTTKVFLSHLHADHIGDIPGLLGSIPKIGRIDPVEIWGGGCDDPELGLEAFVKYMTKAMAWDRASLRGARPTTGLEAIGHEIPYDRPAEIYERNGVKISSFPAIHGLSGAVGYKLEYAGRSVVFSGDTRPCRFVVEAATGADLLIHECFQSPSVVAAAMSLPLETAVHVLKAAHTIPDQMGQVLDLAKPRMGAVWHLDVSPGVDRVFEDIGAHYGGAVAACQDLTIFNITADAVIARQAQVNDAPQPVHGPSKTKPVLDPAPEPPAWWVNASLATEPAQPAQAAQPSKPEALTGVSPQGVSRAVSPAVSPEQAGVQRALAGGFRPAVQLIEHLGEQWLQSLLVAGLAALLAETTRGAIQQRAEQGLHTLLQKAFEPLPHSTNSQELQAQTERTLQAILRDSLEAVFAQAMLPKTQQQGEQAIRASLHGDFGAVLRTIEGTLKAILEALVAVLREQWQRVLRLQVAALLVVLESSLEKSLVS